MNVVAMLLVGIVPWPPPSQFAEMRRLHNEALVKRASQVFRSSTAPVPLPDRDRIRRNELAGIRTEQKLLEWVIEFNAELLATHGHRFTAEDVARIHGELAHWQDELQDAKRRERALWEQQPGGITAPMPREVKK